MDIVQIGAFCFGVVVGWITHRTLRRKRSVALNDIASVLAAVGGAAVTGLFEAEVLFAWYSIGLLGGFFLYLILAATVLKNLDWLGGE